MLLTEHIYLYLFLVFCLGLVIGSFLNVVIYRLPIMLKHQWHRQSHEFLRQHESPQVSPETTNKVSNKPFNLFWPLSHCPHCEATIRPWENIPLISFLWLRGKCAHCQATIPWRYPLIELTSALLALLVAYHFGVTFIALVAMGFTWCLLVLAAIDINHQLLPDDLTLSLLWFGLLVNLFGMFTDIYSAIIGAVAGYCSLWLVNQLFKLSRGKEGMGYGDFKLFAALGAWFGWQLLPLIILAAALVGAVVGICLLIFKGHDKQIPIPFGPYLAGAAFIALLWGPQILQTYLALIN